MKLNEAVDGDEIMKYSFWFTKIVADLTYLLKLKYRFQGYITQAMVSKNLTEKQLELLHKANQSIEQAVADLTVLRKLLE